MGDGFNGTFECSNCGCEGAYFNGVQYECPDCGREWNADSVIERELTDNDRKKSFYFQQELSFFKDKIDEKFLMKLLSPSRKFEKWLELYSEPGISEDYQDELTRTLINTELYSSVLKVHCPEEISEQEKNKIIERSVTQYLESRDCLPVFPTVKDWAEYIGAPEDFIERILPKEGVEFKRFMPFYSDSDFEIIFHSKLNDFYLDRLKKGNNPEDEFPFHFYERIFTALIEEEKPSFDDNEADTVSYYLKKGLHKEFEVIRKYRNDYKASGFAEYKSLAKEKNLSVIETIIFIMNIYLTDVMA